MNPPLQQSLPELLAASVARHADLPAIRTDEGSIRFAEFDARSDRIAAALAARGIGKGDRVALYAPNCPEFPIAYFGIVKAGATVVPVNVLLNPKEVAFILQDAGVKALFYHPVLKEAVEAVRGRMEGLDVLLSLADAVVDGSDDWRQLVSTDTLAPRPEFRPDEDLVAIIYTSGTTGRPKGAMLTHRNLAANTWSVQSVLDITPGRDAVLVVLPMFHSFAATAGMLTSLLYGITILPLPRFEPETVARTIETLGATIFMGVPSMYSMLLRLPESFTSSLSGLRMCVSGGAAMPVDVMRRFESRFGVGIHEGDGPTECSPVTCLNPLDGERKPASVGLPVPLVEMAIMDEHGQRLADGEMGEICVRGPNVMKGYWNLPEATAESFFGEWFRTGDIGYRDEDGYFFMVDRKKDLIIVNGMNVYPRIVEEVLYRHPAVQEAAVVGEPHELHGEIPVAYVALRDGQEVGSAELRAFCRDNLGRHEVPRKVFFVADLPKNATGKILKRELRKGGEFERGVDSREV
jgi:long-chain acyl-CoA synthetase